MKLQSLGQGSPKQTWRRRKWPISLADGISCLRRCLPGIAAAFSIIGLLQLGLWYPLEQTAYAHLFHWRGPLLWNERIVLIAIDDASLQQLGQFPLSRQHYATLLNRLMQAQPNVVVFDLVFSEDKPEDDAFATALRRHQKAVLAQAWNGANAPWNPTSVLQQAAIATGHIANRMDTDGLTRQIRPQIQAIPALSVVATQVYSMVAAPVPLPDLNAPLWINWPGPARTLTHYSFADVVSGRVPAAVFKDKIVLVGLTAMGTDPLITPFDRNPPAGGVHLHAAAIDNLLNQAALQVPASSWLILGLLVMGPSLSYGITHRRTLYQLALWLAACLGWSALCLVLFRANYWLPLVAPLGLFSLTTAFVRVADRLKLEADNHRLHRLATLDALTQVANRRHFEDCLHGEWQRSLQEGKPLALILCDVDYFKKYNDTYGHPAGDRCLQQVARAIQEIAKRSVGLAARYGGEEFAIILPTTQLEAAIYIAEAIRVRVRSLAIPHAASQVSPIVTLSLGVSSLLPGPDQSIASLIASADTALYQAKQRGRDRWCVYR